MPDVTLGELRLLPGPANERLRHAHPGAGMLTAAAPSGTGGTPAAVTDGGGGADMRRASSRRSVRESRSASWASRTHQNGLSVAPSRSPVSSWGGHGSST